MMAGSLRDLCVTATFHGLTIPAAEILAINAALETNVSMEIPDSLRFTQPSVSLTNASFCNVTVTYTHPGQDDRIGVETWLPLDGWNERLQSAGGGGSIAGRFGGTYANMYGALADGYATSTTDAGLPPDLDTSSWAHVSPGNVNLYNLQNLGSISLGDQAIIAKSVISNFYGKPPKYSYWNGCSQGGRQGIMLAQRYPDAYDGIATGAPGLYWTETLPQLIWAQQVMNELQQYPFPCELDAITLAAISACDKLDGVVDGIIGEPVKCLKTFNAKKLVGTEIVCAQTNATKKVSEVAVKVVTAAWQGPTKVNGDKIFYGMLPGADLTGNLPTSLGLGVGPALTVCDGNVCVGTTNPPAQQWLQLFVAKNHSMDVSQLTREEFVRLVHLGGQMYRSFLSTDDADLLPFHKAGGKMITFHGLADNGIPPQATEHYYNTVSEIVPEVKDFYRYFEVPGLGHCGLGPSGLPTNLFEDLRAWVENGTVPEHSPITVRNTDGEREDRIVCPYPRKPKLNNRCGDSGNRKCWRCA
ncbi:putative feruloyl esterase [Paramyrothecium foliicola]|nr:putative feruloyl esterase [Paramyrothecium foliicola]